MSDWFLGVKPSVTDPTAILNNDARIRTTQFGRAARKNARDPKISDQVGQTYLPRQATDFHGQSGYAKSEKELAERHALEMQRLRDQRAFAEEKIIREMLAEHRAHQARLNR